jgi:hypothetical protein
VETAADSCGVPQNECVAELITTQGKSYGRLDEASFRKAVLMRIFVSGILLLVPAR